ncbi:MAG: TolC family protein [Fimbriimonadales bacterium]
MKPIFCFVVVMFAALAPSQRVPRRMSLAEAIQLAHQDSPILGAAKSDAAAARAGARATKAGTLPQLSANGFATTGNNVSIVSSSPMVEPAAWMLVPTGSFLDGNLSLMIPIIAPRAYAMAGVANWQARAAAGELAEATAELDLQVTDAYDRVLLARQMVLAGEAKLAAAYELVSTTQALFDAGKGIGASVQRTQAELSQAQRLLTTVYNEEAKSILDLQALIGMDMSLPVDPSDTLVGAAPPVGLDEFLVRAKQSRGMLLAARARLQASNWEVRSAEGQRLPQLYGVAMGDATSRRDMGGVTAGLTLSLPLFDGGRISAETSKAKAMRAKADAEVRQAELTVEKEVRQAWLDVRTAKANAESADSAVKAAQSAYDVTALRVSAGKSILVEQLDALEALTRAKADLAQATFDQAIASARLVRAAGGKP